MTRKPIIRDGALIGYRLYRPGLLGALSFVGYQWRK